jgi:hypothetical protein
MTVDGLPHGSRQLVKESGSKEGVLGTTRIVRGGYGGMGSVFNADHLIRIHAQILSGAVERNEFAQKAWEIRPV